MKTPLPSVIASLLCLSLFVSCKKEETVPPEEAVVDLNDGLVAWYPFEGNLRDSSGNGNHGANLAGAGSIAFTSDKAGRSSGAVLMDGVDDVILADDKGSLVTPTSVTISAYFLTTSNQIQNLVCKRNQYVANSPSEFGGLAWSINANTGGDPHFAVISPVNADCATPRGIDETQDLVFGLQNIATGQGTRLNQWYHIVCMFTEGSQRIYINGRLRQATTRTFTSMRQCPGGKLVIGGYVDDLPTLFKGAIDDLRVYNRPLNSFEIAALAKGY